MDYKKQMELLQDLCLRQRDEIEALKKLLPKTKTRRSGRTSQFKGVSFDRMHNVWRVQMRIAGKVRPLGTFAPTPEGEREAAEAYNKAVADKEKLQAMYEAKDEQKRNARKKRWEVPQETSAKGMSAADVFGSM